MTDPALALSTSESIEVALGASTLALALATAWMAWHVRGQAIETRRLADTAERQLAASTVPVVRVMRDDKAEYADMVTVNKGDRTEALVVRLENRSPVPAEIERITLSPGGKGALANTGMPETPTLEPNSEWDVDFHPSESERAEHDKEWRS